MALLYQHYRDSTPSALPVAPWNSSANGSATFVVQAANVAALAFASWAIHDVLVLFGGSKRITGTETEKKKHRS